MIKKLEETVNSSRKRTCVRRGDNRCGNCNHQRTQKTIASSSSARDGKFSALAAALRFGSTPSLRPPLTTLFVEALGPFALLNSLEMFLRLTQFPQVLFSVGIGLSSSKNDATDYEKTVVTIDGPCAAVTSPK
ncbi:hypothetical protein TNCV_2186601 [Trichonephila clavipes]|nr:hypothetical protein TNCV_2186601 [Trichonephila clavipes]